MNCIYCILRIFLYRMDSCSGCVIPAHLPCVCMNAHTQVALHTTLNISSPAHGSEFPPLQGPCAPPFRGLLRAALFSCRYPRIILPVNRIVMHRWCTKTCMVWHTIYRKCPAQRYNILKKEIAPLICKLLYSKCLWIYGIMGIKGFRGIDFFTCAKMNFMLG